jgi:aspartyl protease family protein
MLQKLTHSRTPGSRRRFAALIPIILAFLTTSVAATEIGVVGLFPGKAVLVVDDGMPTTFAVGSTIVKGSHLIAVDDEFATITFKGKPQKIAIGSHVNRSASGAISSIVLQANAQGHYVTQGLINGGSIKLLVDTGATLVAIPAADAIRLGIDYRQGRRGYVTTANGQAAVYQIQLDSVKIGDIELSQVDATIQETGLPFALLGMSFLSRTDMNRSGTKMTLTKRY